MAKKANIRFGDAKESLQNAISLSRLFASYVVKPEIQESISLAALAKRDGKEALAIDFLQDAERGIRNTVAGFFRRSPEHFQKRYQECATKSYDADILQRLAKSIAELSQLANSQLLIDLSEAAKLHVATTEMVAWAHATQRERLANREKRDRELKAAQLLQQQEQQRQRERNEQEANSVEELLAMLPVRGALRPPSIDAEYKLSASQPTT